MSQVALPVLSELVTDARNIDPLRGDTAGQCLICSRITVDGHPPRLSKTFMDSSLFLRPPEGTHSNICWSCWHMLHVREYRWHSWLVIPGSFRFLSRAEARGVLDELPAPPFALYLTIGHRKHGWLRVRIAESTSKIPLTVDETLYWLDRADLAPTIACVRSVAGWLDSWRWFHNKVRVEDEGRLALGDQGLYEWYRLHRRSPLVLTLVYFCCRARTEAVNVVPVSPQDPLSKDRVGSQTTLDSWLNGTVLSE